MAPQDEMESGFGDYIRNDIAGFLFYFSPNSLGGF